MDSLEVKIITGVLTLAALYELFTARVLPLVGSRWKWIGRRLPKPDDFCPRCEQLALERVYHFDGFSNPPTPTFYQCQHCGARWKRFFTGPLEVATDAEYDHYAGPEAFYRDEGLLDNGKEPMTVVPFEPNWVKCPNCGWRFRLDFASRSGDFPVHVSCGQRLIITSDG